jgi:polyhydroxyalkanoate synthesis regulator phasin
MSTDKQMKINKLEKLVDYLRVDGHSEDAEALIVVDHLMREYAFSDEPMEENAKNFSQLLQDLVTDWTGQIKNFYSTTSTMSADMNNKPEPMAWAVMQPDSYSVFVSYDQALEHREDCAGGDIVPLYKEEDSVQKMLHAIRSAQFDELNLPEITEKNTSTVKPEKLPKK